MQFSCLQILTFYYRCCLDVVVLTGRFDSIVMAAPSAPGGGHVCHVAIIASISLRVDLLKSVAALCQPKRTSYVRFGLAYPSVRVSRPQADSFLLSALLLRPSSPLELWKWY